MANQKEIPLLISPDAPINIGSAGLTSPEAVLSNFAPTPFVLDGVEYPSTESF